MSFLDKLLPGKEELKKAADTQQAGATLTVYGGIILMVAYGVAKAFLQTQDEFVEEFDLNPPETE